METINFEEVVRKMTAKEIILAMVEGLENPATDVVSMYTFECFSCQKQRFDSSYYSSNSIV